MIYSLSFKYEWNLVNIWKQKKIKYFLRKNF